MSLLTEAGAGINSGPSLGSISSCSLPSTHSYDDSKSHNHSDGSYLNMNLKLNFTPLNLKGKKRARSTSSSSDNTCEYMFGTPDNQKEQEKANGCETSELSRFKHRKGGGNGDQMGNEGTKLNLGELGLLPTAKSLRKKLLKTSLGYKENHNEKVISRIEFYHGDNLSQNKLEEVTQLTKINMESLYNENGPHWSWDDKKKIWELTQPEVRLILVYGDRDHTSTRPELEITKIGEECKSVLVGMIEKIPAVQVRDLIDEMVDKVQEKDNSLTIQPSTYASQGESDDACLIGVAVFSFLCTYNIPHLYVQELQIRRSHRGKGIGSVMMEHIHEIAKATNQKMLMLTAFRNNPKAVKFYKKLGYDVDEASPGPCFNVTNSPHELLSMTLDESLKQHRCIEEGCCANFRFKESLTRHQCIEHKKDWPFVCTADGCGLGVITKDQRRKHMKLQHGIIFRKPKVKKEPNPAYSNRRKRQPRNSDYMFALMLQKQEARRSSRRRTASSKLEDYEYYSPIKSNIREVRDKKASGPAPPGKKKIESLVKDDLKAETQTTSSKGESEPKNLYQKIGLIGKEANVLHVERKEPNTAEKADIISGIDKKQDAVVKKADDDCGTDEKPTNVAAKTEDHRSTGLDSRQQLEVDKNNPEFQKAVKIAYAMVNCICKDEGYNETVTATAIAKAITAETYLSAEVVRLAIVHAALKAKKEVACTNRSERANMHFGKSLGAKFSIAQAGEIGGIQNINIEIGCRAEKNKIVISHAVGRKTKTTVRTVPNVTKAGTETSKKAKGDSNNTKDNSGSGSSEKQSTKKEENGSTKESKSNGGGTTDNFGEGGYNSDETDRSDADKGKKKDDDHSTDTYDNSSEDEDIPLSKLVKKKKGAVSMYVKKNIQKTQQLRERLQRIYEDSLMGNGEKTRLKKRARKRKIGLSATVDSGKSARKSDEESTQEEETFGQREDEEMTDNERVDDSKDGIIKIKPSEKDNEVAKSAEVKMLKREESTQKKSESDTSLSISRLKKHPQSPSPVITNVKSEKLQLSGSSPPPTKKEQKKTEKLPPPPMSTPAAPKDPAKKAEIEHDIQTIVAMSKKPGDIVKKSKRENQSLIPAEIVPNKPEGTVRKSKHENQSIVPEEIVPNKPEDTVKKSKHENQSVVPEEIVPNKPEDTVKKPKHAIQAAVTISKPEEPNEVVRKTKHHRQASVSDSTPKEPTASDRKPKPDIPPPPPPPPPPKERQLDTQLTETSPKEDTMKSKLSKDNNSSPCQSVAKKGDSDIPPPPPPPPPPSTGDQNLSKKGTEKAKRKLDVNKSLKRSEKAKKKPKYVDSPGSSDSSEDIEGESSADKDEDYTEVDDGDRDGDVDQDYLLALKLQRELNARGRRRTGRN